MVSLCESWEDVFRYAWFYERGNFPESHFAYLFTLNDGELSTLGKFYISLPYQLSTYLKKKFIDNKGELIFFI